MKKYNFDTISTLPLKRPREEKIYETCLTALNKCEHILITHLACRLRRLPAGFYVAVEFDGVSTTTSNKAVSISKDVAEWDDEIILPSTRSSVISFQVYASFEQGSKLGSGEPLGRFRISVEEVLYHIERLEPIRFIAATGDELVSSCLSLRIVVEQRNCDGSECKTRPELPKTVTKSEVEELADEGHRALLHYRRGRDQSHLDKAIQCFERVCDDYPTDYPNRCAALFNLANAKSIHYQAHNHYLDLDVSIALYRDALRLRSTGHPDHIMTALELGFALLARFQRNGNEMDKTEVVDLLDRVVELAPADSHTHRAGWFALQMANVSPSLQPRDIEASDGMDNVHLIDRTRAMLYTSPCWDLRRPVLLARLGGLLHRRFEEHGDLADIYEAISVLDEAVELVPNGHANKLDYLNSLGGSLRLRFERLGNAVDMERSIFILEEALRLVPDGHPDKPTLLNNLGISLYRRFGRLGDVADVMKLVSMNEEAVRLTSDGHPNKPSLLNNLGTSLFCRFERLDDVADITRSVSKIEEAIHHAPDGHPDKPSWLNNLGNSLLIRFERLGDIADLTKSVSIKEEAVRLTPDGHPDKPCWLNNLGNSLIRRFERLGDITDITKSVSVIEGAVRLTPDGHVDKPGLFNNLGSSLLIRFEHLGHIADITKSISMFEEAVHLTPDGHPDKPRRLNSLGGSLHSRFERLGDVVDLTKSVSVIEEAVRLIPDGHPDKSRFLNNLGCSLSLRFELFGDVADITKSVLMIEEAVRLTPDGHPYKPTWLYHLGDSFRQHFNRSRDLLHLSVSTSYFSSVAKCSTGSAFVRFQAARMWIWSTQFKGNSETLLDAFTIALGLLPQLAWMGLPLTERHRVLLDAADIVRDAAAVALGAGYPDMAVEWLEQGRSIVWNQFLQLRTPVDLLRATHPVLADEFEQTSKQLESAGSRGCLASHGTQSNLGHNYRSLEDDEVQMHHTLAFRREKLLADIRSLPGFDRFLLPKSIEQLSSLVTSGPVVYLNASAKRCDALIITAGLGNVIPVSLSGVTYRHVERMHQLLLDPSLPTVSSDDVSLLTPSGERRAVDREGGPAAVEDIPVDRFQLVLRFLWSDVVNPVLDALGFSTSPSEVEKMPRIFWCPTGPFAFLPIHAAGIYDTSPADSKLSDFAISSYIPTLGALAPLTGQDAYGDPSNVCLVTVPQPSSDGQSRLPNVVAEINHIQALSAESRFITLKDSDSTVEDVMGKMVNADWVHFACHGMQDPVYPLDSGLCLANLRRLKLSDIIRLSRPQGGLAFLSACQTAKGDEKLSEESVHLAAGMLLAGYSGVIATMWSIMDNDAPKVTRDVYQHLFRDGRIPDTTEAAEALHRAVVRLRDEDKVPFSSWVPFIHLGR